MNELLAIVSAVLVSLIAFSSAFLFSLQQERLKQVVFVLVSFAVGVLLGNVCFHLIPESCADFEGRTYFLATMIGGGFLFFLFVERLIHFYSAHRKEQKNVKSYGYLVVSLGAIHSFTDGIIIMLAWLSDSHTGIAATIAIALHELPHVIARFGVLLKAGFTKKRALLYNFYASSVTILGAVFTFCLGEKLVDFSIYTLPFIIGGFLYLICFALLPELLSSINKRNFFVAFLSLFLGILLMYLIHSQALVEHVH